MRRSSLQQVYCWHSLPPSRVQTPGAAAAADQAMLKQYCLGCHSDRLKTGNLVLENLDPSNPAGHIETWEKVVRKVRAGMMPPSASPRPTRTQLDEFAGRLETALDHEAAAHPNPGSIALHRLNRAEYANVIRDLLAVDIDASTMLPADDSSEGFDNIANALRMSPALLESATTAAATYQRGLPLATLVSGPLPPPIACPADLGSPATSRDCRWEPSAACRFGTRSHWMRGGTRSAWVRGAGQAASAHRRAIVPTRSN